MAYPRNDVKQWFVMRDLRRSNAKETAYQLLMKHGYEAFTPMTLQKNRTTGKKELVPILHWLLFLHASKNEIDHIIDPASPVVQRLQYNYERGKSARFGGMVVSDRAMQYFRMALAKQAIPVVYRSSDITPSMRGRRVLVVRGDMMGYYGHLQKYTGGKNMRLFVELEGLCLAPIQISPEDVKFMDEVPVSVGDEQTYYTRLSRMVDVINYLRFSIPDDLSMMSDSVLATVRQTFAMAESLFDEFRVKEYLCIDEVCRDRLAVIDKEIASRGNLDCPTDPDSPWLERMEQLCRAVRTENE